MNDATRFLREKIDKLTEERAGNTVQIEKFQGKNNVLDAQIRVLREVLADSEPAEERQAEATMVPVVHSPEPEMNGERKLGPADSILKLLRDHPHGLKRKEIVAALRGKIQSSSSNQGRVLLNTIINLRNRESVVVENDYIKLP